jgi:hypothetical protein
MSEIESFPPEVSRELKTYVYRLIDPRNGETFYVGKGRGDRVFAHVHGEQKLEGDEIDNKIKRIREIQRAGFEVAHVIHRHGMNDETAFEVECPMLTLLYLFWEPLNRSEFGECTKHSAEVGAFAQAVANSPIKFRWMTYNDLWDEWSVIPDLAAHASHLKARYQVRL